MKYLDVVEFFFEFFTTFFQSFLSESINTATRNDKEHGNDESSLESVGGVFFLNFFKSLIKMQTEYFIIYVLAFVY